MVRPSPPTLHRTGHNLWWSFVTFVLLAAAGTLLGTAGFSLGAKGFDPILVGARCVIALISYGSALWAWSMTPWSQERNVLHRHG